MIARDVLERVDVHLVLEPRHAGEHVLRSDPEQVGALGQHRLRGHPEHVGGELVGDLRPGVGLCEQVSTRDVDLIGERQRHGFARPAPRPGPRRRSRSARRSTPDPTRRRRRRSPGRIDPEATVPEKPRKSRSGRLTHCTGKRKGLPARACSTSSVSRYSISVRPVVPGHPLRAPRHVVTEARRQRNRRDGLEPEGPGERRVLVDDLVETARSKSRRGRSC